MSCPSRTRDTPNVFDEQSPMTLLASPPQVEDSGNPVEEDLQKQSVGRKSWKKKSVQLLCPSVMQSSDGNRLLATRDITCKSVSCFPCLGVLKLSAHMRIQDMGIHPTNDS
ncbi:hypothetical protein N7468_008421 [Penicillium chermesinum]|uniref:Uncharacterized protein n=1 Tax=Penicillium chermesinum TaxID=63820 RepID=A0A9W9TIM6_9EURO|nr:uncharacterized protein N7468_008421 [Penicillium chermesinum]KAJ5223879.1 hypothetical protein N7468_008421 [Penicillium chermesinum]